MSQSHAQSSAVAYLPTAHLPPFPKPGPGRKPKGVASILDARRNRAWHAWRARQEAEKSARSLRSSLSVYEIYLAMRQAKLSDSATQESAE